MPDVFRSLSLGGGQGSSALLVACADGLVVNGFDFGSVRPDLVQFADTGGELQATYRHVATLTEYCAARGIEVRTVRRTGLSLPDRILGKCAGTVRSAPQVPWQLAPTGKAGQQCTTDYKSKPLDASTKRTAKARKASRVEILIGFTVEEWMRVRDPRKDWPDGWTFRYPMIEARVNRGWAQEVCRAALGYVPEPSACAFCPHRPDVGPGGRAWIRANEPKTWDLVVRVDDAIRHRYAGLRQDAYISRRLVPVDRAIDGAETQGTLFRDGSEGCDEGRCFT